MKITNAKDRPVDRLSNSLPDVSGAIQLQLQPVTALILQKQQIDGYTQEIPLEIRTMAAIQSLDPQQLKMLPEGQRTWKWSIIYTLTDFRLYPDDGFIMNEIPYRVMAKKDWSAFGYHEYHVIEDYSFDIPAEVAA